jgi:hypothetical protein
MVLLGVFIAFLFDSIGDAHRERWMAASLPLAMGLLLAVLGFFVLWHQLRDRSLARDSEDPVEVSALFLWIGGTLAIAWLVVATDLLPPLAAPAVLFPAWALGVVVLAAALIWPGSRRQSRQAIPQ